MADHEILIHDGASRSELIFVSARQHVLISDNSPVRKNYFDSNFIKKENAGILQCLQLDYFEADIVRSQMFTSDVIKAAFYMLNGKNVNVMLESEMIFDSCTCITLLHSEQPKLCGVLAVLSATGLNRMDKGEVCFTYFCDL